MAPEPHRRPEVGPRTHQLRARRRATGQHGELPLLKTADREVCPSSRRTPGWLPRGRSGRSPCLHLLRVASVVGPAGAPDHSVQGR
eukprot:6690758-Alexandrium_andersonii.AAC.1